MYLPGAFQVTDRETIFPFVEAHSFGLLCSMGENAPFASHLPFLLEREAGPHGTLVGHMARANPQWRQADGQPVLVVFSGPHAYISPQWYASEPAVPTWNYAAVHAYGVFEPLFEIDEILEVTAAAVQQYESGRPTPWTFDAESEYAARMTQAVVAFRVEVTRWEGKWKLSQNHPIERRQRVIDGLRATGQAGNLEVAELMEQRLPPAESSAAFSSPLSPTPR